MIKKPVALFCSLLILFILSPNAFAASTAHITPVCENSVLHSGDILNVKALLEKNPGLMGFRITITYPEDVLELSCAEKGDILRTGMFSDSISNSVEGTFDILWSDTCDMSDAGELFSLVFKVKSDVKPGSYEVGFSFSSDDTFNEKWEDVEIVFSDASFEVRGNDTPEWNAASLLAKIRNILTDFMKRLISAVCGYMSPSEGV